MWDMNCGITESWVHMERLHAFVNVETFISTTQYNSVDFTILIINKQAIFQNNSLSCTLNSSDGSVVVFFKTAVAVLMRLC